MKFAQLKCIYKKAYASTEGFIGINPYPDKIEYIMIPDSCFYEFIKLDDIYKENPKTYLINEVNKNENYEIVLTTINGLYRYRLGDIVKVTGFYNDTSKIKFLFRKNMLLNMVSEKTTENHVNAALMQVIKNYNLNIIDYTTYADNGVTPGRYIFYLEMENFNCKYGIDMFESELDKQLMKCNPAYERFRKSKRLQRLKVKFVKRGTFKKYKDNILKTGVSGNQIKIPRVIKSKDIIEKL
ncbi:GH3 auxin-responsive promoter family protein [uncultured Clostridium sp.]|uniref:GH3 family domain-containing protein n=1 Tax=uncultured Clostridium sp. TaxID=59620 RepID=UPI0025CD2FA8|nr:GH3 auxin-responsive promoter family protein [uncultured Clostridium sp.]